MRPRWQTGCACFPPQRASLPTSLCATPPGDDGSGRATGGRRQGRRPPSLPVPSLRRPARLTLEREIVWVLSIVRAETACGLCEVLQLAGHDRLVEAQVTDALAGLARHGVCAQLDGWWRLVPEQERAAA